MDRAGGCSTSTRRPRLEGPGRGRQSRDGPDPRIARRRSRRSARRIRPARSPHGGASYSPGRRVLRRLQQRRPVGPCSRAISSSVARSARSRSSAQTASIIAWLRAAMSPPRWRCAIAIRAASDSSTGKCLGGDLAEAGDRATGAAPSAGRPGAAWAAAQASGCRSPRTRARSESGGSGPSRRFAPRARRRAQPR